MVGDVPMPDASRKQAVTELLVATCLWSTGGALIKLVDWNPLALCGTRSAIAALLLIALYRKIQFHWSLNLWGAALGYALSVVFFVAGTKLTSAANVIALQYAAPVYLALVGPWALGERTTRADWGTIVVGLSGILLLFSDGFSAHAHWGDLCGVFSGMALAVFAIFMRRQHRHLPIQSVILGNLLAMLGCLPFMFDGGPPLAGWGYLFILGVLQLGIPYALYARAIRHLSALEAALIPMFEPVLNPLWAFLIVGEVPGMKAGFGCSLILLAAGLRARISAASSSR
jgi:drug/metabolite transporter (DMT)-like permease